MTKVYIPQDPSQVDQWVRFLNDSAYRGYGINKLSIRLEEGKLNRITYDQAKNIIEYQSTDVLQAQLFIDRLSKRCSFARWNHKRKLKNADSKYAKAFHQRINALANQLVQNPLSVDSNHNKPISVDSNYNKPNKNPQNSGFTVKELLSIHTDKKLCSQIRYNAIMRNQFQNDLQGHLDSFPVPKRPKVYNDEKWDEFISTIKSMIMEGYLNIIDSDDQDIAKIVTEDDAKLHFHPEIYNYLDGLVQAGVIWAYGHQRLQKFIIPSPMSDEMFANYCDSGKWHGSVYYLKDDQFFETQTHSLGKTEQVRPPLT